MSNTVISTFSGPGGSSLGYEQAGCDVSVALDCAPGDFSNAIPDTYRRNHPDTAFIEKDARETTPAELLGAADLEQGQVDILDGSPPCSPFSKSNSTVTWGNHESGTLFDRYAYFVKEIQPRVFVAENVVELSQGKTKGYYKQLCENLRGAGYNLRVQNIDAAYLGAPHHRRRLLFMGVRKDVGHPPKILPTQRPTTVREAWQGYERDEEAVRKQKKACERSELYPFYQKLPPDARTSIEDVRQDGSVSGFKYYRLSYRKPSVTLTHSYNSYVHLAEDRFLTLGEAQRLMGLPDSYECPNWETIIRCLPPVLLKTIANRLQSNKLI